MMVDGYMTPARFRALREAAGVSMSDAARQMGVSVVALWGYENGRSRAPSVGEWRVYRCADWLAEQARESADA